MDSRSRTLFLILILTQAVHSLEEYVFRLWEVFAPARMVSGLVSDDLETGFLVVNASLVLLGIWGYLARVRPEHTSARGWAWFWVLLELGNGAGHTILALSQGGYFPGFLTALPLLAISIYLGLRMLRTVGG